MKHFFLFLVILFKANDYVNGEFEYYSGLRPRGSLNDGPMSIDVVAPEDYLIEQMGPSYLTERRSRSGGLMRPHDQSTDPGFSYFFPPHRESGDEIHQSRFAVAPSDPRYYQDIHPSKDIYQSIPNLEQEIEKGLERAASGGLHWPLQAAEAMAPPPPLPVEPLQPYLATEKPPENLSTMTSTASSSALLEPEPTHSGISINLLKDDDKSDIYFFAIVAGCTAAIVMFILAIGFSWYRIQKKAKAAADVEYPAYGITGPNNKELSPTGDRRLAQSAQMYHYQHQKQQIIAMEGCRGAQTTERTGSVSEPESDDENEEGDYTVYECPGLASTGEMEVKNPLFQDDPTPATPSAPVTTSDTSSNQKRPVK